MKLEQWVWDKNRKKYGQISHIYGAPHEGLFELRDSIEIHHVWDARIEHLVPVEPPEDNSNELKSENALEKKVKNYGLADVEEAQGRNFYMTVEEIKGRVQKLYDVVLLEKKTRHRLTALDAAYADILGILDEAETLLAKVDIGRTSDANGA